jgi:hypothetical protein
LFLLERVQVIQGMIEDYAFNEIEGFIKENELRIKD